MTLSGLFSYETTPIESSPELKLLGSGEYLGNKLMPRLILMRVLSADSPNLGFVIAVSAFPVPTWSPSIGEKNLLDCLEVEQGDEGRLRK